MAIPAPSPMEYWDSLKRQLDSGTGRPGKPNILTLEQRAWVIKHTQAMLLKVTDPEKKAKLEMVLASLQERQARRSKMAQSDGKISIPGQRASGAGTSARGNDAGKL